MKRFFKRLFKRPVENESVDILSIANRIGPRIDRAAHEIFVRFGPQLMNKPVAHVIPGVWGARKDGALDPLQEEIHSALAPDVDEILETLEVDAMRPEQAFAVGYLLRGLLSTKIIYMLEFLKNHAAVESDSGSAATRFLMEQEPAGSA